MEAEKKRIYELKRRIRQGDLKRRDVKRRLAELAFGQVNDCVKLVMEESPDLDALDLSLLTEIKRSDTGRVDIKLMDRLRVLEQLEQAIGAEENGMGQFLDALKPGSGEKL